MEGRWEGAARKYVCVYVFVCMKNTEEIAGRTAADSLLFAKDGGGEEMLYAQKQD